MSDEESTVKPKRPPEDLHPDRTQSVPIVWMCRNPECAASEKDSNVFQFESDRSRCPKCGSEGPPTVNIRSLVHLLVPNPKGPIQGQVSRWEIACDPMRDLIATRTNAEAGSDNPQAVNCPTCLKRAFDLRIRSATGTPITRESLLGE